MKLIIEGAFQTAIVALETTIKLLFQNKIKIYIVIRQVNVWGERALLEINNTWRYLKACPCRFHYKCVFIRRWQTCSKLSGDISFTSNLFWALFPSLGSLVYLQAFTSQITRHDTTCPCFETPSTYLGYIMAKCLTSGWKSPLWEKVSESVR